MSIFSFDDNCYPCRCHEFQSYRKSSSPVFPNLFWISSYALKQGLCNREYTSDQLMTFLCSWIPKKVMTLVGSNFEDEKCRFESFDGFDRCKLISSQGIKFYLVQILFDRLAQFSLKYVNFTSFLHYHRWNDDHQ